MPVTEDNDSMATALALIPSGCSIITAGQGDAATGMLASWVQQASFEPPMVTVSIKEGRPIQAAVESTGCFVLNIIGEDPGELFKHFGAGFGPGEIAFEGLDIATTDFGVKLALAAGCLSCRVRSSSQAADHRVYVAEVCEASAHMNSKPYVHIRKSGLSY
ncbi:MAG: flavin reductase family protein [Planctomycetes bacterium]|nr:flavin reductase family protein [Planctomycetota bacterium]